MTKRTRRQETPYTLCSKTHQPVVLFHNERCIDFRTVRHVDAFKDQACVADVVHPRQFESTQRKDVELPGQRCTALVRGETHDELYEVCSVQWKSTDKFMLYWSEYNTKSRGFEQQSRLVTSDDIISLRGLK